ncbi:hypothetical protein PoB_004100400 [Plakobranchus ocellatus]|uniref:Bursicon n=1 Tax=Plakobranchus ocellatus TaxID=259542 RepID=A0AAV4B710_9GAST|nr:hypothetical protein PoB_004100400 [Plakobranchus ocellatus]
MIKGCLLIPEVVAETSGLTKEQITELVQQAYDERVKAGRALSDAGSDESPNSGKSETYRCPEQTDQSEVYRLGSDPTGYPVQPISDELFLRSLPESDTMFQCLSRQVLQSELNPTLKPQPLLGVPCKGCDNTSFEDIRKVCLPLFRTVSLWAFCPGRPQKARLVRDRIIVPVDCSCTAIQCTKNTPFL